MSKTYLDKKWMKSALCQPFDRNVFSWSPRWVHESKVTVVDFPPTSNTPPHACLWYLTTDSMLRQNRALPQITKNNTIYYFSKAQGSPLCAVRFVHQVTSPVRTQRRLVVRPSAAAAGQSQPAEAGHINSLALINPLPLRCQPHVWEKKPCKNHDNCIL